MGASYTQKNTVILKTGERREIRCFHEVLNISAAASSSTVRSGPSRMVFDIYYLSRAYFMLHLGSERFLEQLSAGYESKAGFVHRWVSIKTQQQRKSRWGRKKERQALDGRI